MVQSSDESLPELGAHQLDVMAVSVAEIAKYFPPQFVGYVVPRSPKNKLGLALNVQVFVEKCTRIRTAL